MRHSTIFRAVLALLLPLGPVSVYPCLTHTDGRKHAVRGVFSGHERSCQVVALRRGLIRSRLRGHGLGEFGKQFRR